MRIYDFRGERNICGERVRLARRKLKLTQKRLAEKMRDEGVTIERDCISRIELGVRIVTDFELCALCKVLGVSSADLLGF